MTLRISVETLDVFSKQTYKLTIIVVSNVGGIVTPTIYVGTIGEATVLL